MDVRSIDLMETVVYSSVLVQVGETALESFVGYQLLVDEWGDPFASSTAADFQPLFNAICQDFLDSLLIVCLTL